LNSDSASIDAACARGQEATIALDIGTNTEISLVHSGRHWSCSCASGPAFEGAHIRDGMRAAPGAVERVRIDGPSVQLHTIGGMAPVGVCGSGILDAVAEMRRAGVVSQRGSLNPNSHPRLQNLDGKPAFVLAPAGLAGHGQPVAVTRTDVNEIQLAKGAIRAGVEVLLHEAGLTDADIQRFIIAGAFGTYLDLDSAVRIGMFPPIPKERFHQAGNAAGSGARRLLLSARLRHAADEIVQEVVYIELTNHPAFSEAYIEALPFP
jgi:uncharacterized 2Fe-2S/4Fe-4S cluster protein (DUF4445 family)